MTMMMVVLVVVVLVAMNITADFLDRISISLFCYIRSSSPL